MRSRWVPMVGALVLAVAGCSGSGSDQPKVLPPVPSATVVASATPTTTAVPVVVPSAAVPATPQGAAAFVRFFYGELNGAFQDGHDERIRALSDPACGTCNILAGAVQSGRRADQKVIGISFQTQSVEAAAEQNGVTLVTVLGLLPRRRFSDHGTVTVLPGAGHFVHSVTLARKNSSWRVRGIQYEDAR